jgi:hypothetical protein
MKTPLFFSFLALMLAVSARAQTKPWIEGEHSGVTQTLAVAVQDAQQWTALWRRHDATKPVPAVDFTKETVVAVFLGDVATSGTKVVVVVQQDPLDSDRLNVFYRVNISKKAFAAQVQCQPFAIVKVPRVATVDVERDGVVATPEHTTPPAQPKFDGTKIRALLAGDGSPSFDGNPKP